MRARSKIIRAAWNRLPNAWKDEVRDKKFNEQSGTCLVCKEPIPDSSGLFACLDHAISVRCYAEMDMPIEEAVAHANHEKNLVVLHPHCNLTKSGQDLEEFLVQLSAGEQVIDEPRKWTPEEIEKRKQASEKFQRRLTKIKRRQTREQRAAEREAKRVEFRKKRLAKRLEENRLKRAERPKEQEKFLNTALSVL